MSAGRDAFQILCDRAGVSAQWTDAFGKRQEVDREKLEAVLTALGLDVSTDAAIRESADALEREDRDTPPLLTGDTGHRLSVPAHTGRWTLRNEDSGHRFEGDGEILLPAEPGYYALEAGSLSCRVAVAPETCFTLADALGTGKDQARAWGLAQQLYALRRDGDGGVGDFRALADFVVEAASYGAASVSISPVHAQFSADPDRFSPYAPSSRVMLNVLHIATDGGGDEARQLEALPLVDWPAVARNKLAHLREAFDQQGEDRAFFEWRRAEGDKLESHALFEALHQALWRDRGEAWNWRDWPEPFRSPEAAGSKSFAAENEREVAFHAWLQYRANQELGAAQQAALDAGMPIGLVSDLAVGTDSGGSHCWSRQGESFVGLTVGAPPDLLQLDGQNWGITAFSGRGLRQNGYRAFVEMLVGAMRHAGGVRIDHAMGLHRLWVVPEGRSAADGAYLRLPETDLLRLLKLESQRHRAIVTAEDLGTVPEDFPERLAEAGIDGMRVLWFEKTDAGFKPPRTWTRQASAMTSTHDLPTVAGWWKGVDIAHRRTLGGSEQAEQRELGERAQDRQALWQAMTDSGAARGAEPPVWDVFPVVDAAINQVGLSACELAVIPTEDVLGLEEAPNIPGTTTEHPNWRRRLDETAGTVLAGERPSARLRALDALRSR